MNRLASKKSFIAPVVWLLSMGVVASLRNLWLLHLAVQFTMQISTMIKLRLFIVPAIMFVEALMYWMVRRRVHHRRDAWRHLIIFTSAYILIYIVQFAANVYLFMHKSAAVDIRTMNNVAIYLFWSIVILAHIFFARLLINVFSRQPVEEAPEGSNLLDDVMD